MLRLGAATALAWILIELVTKVHGLGVHIAEPILLFLTMTLVVDEATRRLEVAVREINTRRAKHSSGASR